jgi:ABC-2 type transport system ATP-binding protein
MARLYGVSDIEQRLPSLLRDLELIDRRRSLPDELSRGMRQKLALGCAFVHDPKVLLLDEPLTGLDPVGIRRMKDAIRQKAADGAAVLLSSHLLDVVSELCARVIVLGHGKAIAEGTPREIAARGALGGSLEDAVLDLLTP